MTTSTATRVWADGDPQPSQEVDTVRDVDGDIWERWMADDDEYPDIWAVPFDPNVVITWDELAKVFGPLTDATDEPTEVATEAATEVAA